MTARGSHFSFGSYRDPRAQLKDNIKKRVKLDADSGQTSKKPIPQSIGGITCAEGQTYDELKSDRMAKGQRFEDPDLSASDRSIAYVRSRGSGIEWKRPHVSV